MPSAAQDAEITALLISPNRELAESFLETLPQTRAFQILADLKSYPPAQTIEIRTRQLDPEVVLLDLATDLDAAVELTRFIAGLNPPVQVVGLHNENDSAAIVQSLRAGAVEFLHAPFEPASQREAIARLRRLVVREAPAPVRLGHVIAFASSKPGSGASTLATQAAFSLQRTSGKRVLLVDCDLTGGTIGYYLKLNHPHSLVDVLREVERLDAAEWNTLSVNCEGVDIVPAPAAPHAEVPDPARLRLMAEHAREHYDWVILDLPTLFNQTTLMAVAECDQAFLVSTPELPSLHLTRKAITLVEQLGFPKERFHVVVNRTNRNEDISTADMEKLFGCKVHARFPNDYFALHRVVTLGQPLGTESELGKAIEAVAANLGEILRTNLPDPDAAAMRPAVSPA